MHYVGALIFNYVRFFLRAVLMLQWHCFCCQCCVVLLLLFNWAPCAFVFMVFGFILLFCRYIYIGWMDGVCRFRFPIGAASLPASTYNFSSTRSYDELFFFLAEMLVALLSLSLSIIHTLLLFQSFAIFAQTSLCIHKSHFRMVYVLKIETV